MLALRPSARALQQPQRIDELRKVTRVDDSNPAAFAHTGNRLRIAEVGIHARRGLEEPDAQQVMGALAVAGLARQEMRKRELLDARDRALEPEAVVIDARLRVDDTIAADVGEAARGG